MNNQCQMKRGFFVMRGCTAAAELECRLCKKAACQRHMAAAVDKTMCVECAGKRSEDEYDDYWIYSFRNRFYTEGYKPFAFADEDYDPFEMISLIHDESDWDDDYTGDFFDS